MRKILTCLAFICIINIALADDCNNPLLQVFNFTGLSEPTTISGLKYCKSLQKGKSCCSADTVNAIQAKAQELGDKLNKIVGDRDKAIVKIRDQVIPGMKQGLQDLKDDSQKALNMLKGDQKQQQGQQQQGQQQQGQQQQGQQQQGQQQQGQQQQGQQQQGQQQQGQQQQGQQQGQQQQGQQQGQQQQGQQQQGQQQQGQQQQGQQQQGQQQQGQQQQGQQQQGQQQQGQQQQGQQQQGQQQGQQQQGQQQGQQQQGQQQQGQQQQGQAQQHNQTQGPPKPLSNTQATKVAQSLQNVAQKVVDSLPDIKKGFNDFQKSRSSCVVELLKLQSAAWCLSCDPAWATKGVSGDNITLSDKTCKRLQSACFSFISGSATQSAVLSVQTISSMIDKVSASFKKISNNDTTGLDDLATAVSADNETTGPDAMSNAQRPVQIPENCTGAENCKWICGGLFKNGKIDETATVVGGPMTDPVDVETDEDGSRRLLQQEEVLVGKKRSLRERVLAANEWDPDQDEAGVTVTFSVDPAGVKNTDSSSDSGNGSLMMKSGLMCVIGLLGVLFI